MSKSSLHQAAVILKSLPKSQAAKILSRLEAGDIKTVFEAIDSLDHVSAKEISFALRQLSEESQESPSVDPESELGKYLDRLQTVTPTRPSESASGYRPFAFVEDLDPDIRQKLLVHEHPKNIATVLADLPPDVSSEVIRQLDPPVRVSVLRRLCDTELVGNEEAAQLSYALKLRLKKLINQNAYNKSGVDIVAELLSCSDPETKNDVLAHMVQSDPDLAERIENSVFEFSNIATLSDEEIKRLLKQTDTSIWAPALKRASLEVRQKILSNMAGRAAKLLSEEISTIGNVDEHISNRAQQQVINLILRLRRTQFASSTNDGPAFNSPSDSPYYIRP